MRMLMTGAQLPAGWYLVGANPTIVERPFAALAADVQDLRARIATDPSSARARRRQPTGGSCD
jgi:hypothetical protein